jgi:hypothetical protein
MRWRIPLFLTLVALVAVSCDQQPVEPIGEQAVAEAPTFNFMNGPEIPGKSPVSRFVLEGDSHYWCGSTDPASDLFAFRYDAWDYFCNEGSGHPEWDFQAIDHVNHNYSGQGGDEPLYIYDMTDLFEAADFCGFLANEWLYHGMMTTMRANESWNGDFTEGIFQFKAHGIVNDPDGNEYRYREHQKWTSNRGWVHEDIVVH